MNQWIIKTKNSLPGRIGQKVKVLRSVTKSDIGKFSIIIGYKPNFQGEQVYKTEEFGSFHPSYLEIIRS